MGGGGSLGWMTVQRIRFLMILGLELRMWRIGSGAVAGRVVCVLENWFQRDHQIGGWGNPRGTQPPKIRFLLTRRLEVHVWKVGHSASLRRRFSPA